jgi:hypothetical protein
MSTPLFSQSDSLTVAPSSEIFNNEDETRSEYRVAVDLDIGLSFPTGEFKDFYSKDVMGGAGLAVLFPMGKKIPLDIGIGLGYDAMSRSEDVYEYYAPGVGDYDIHSKVSGTMISSHLMARLYPLKFTNFPIQPYIEGLAGGRMFVVEQELSTYVYTLDSDLPSETNRKTTGSWSYGFGGGVKVMIRRNEKIFLNFKATQIYGTSTEYMDPSSVVLYDDGTSGYNVFKSRTDILRFSLGIHIMIN